jgi:hypothetical protein
LMCSLFTRS